jgi:hypothetical protein
MAPLQREECLFVDPMVSPLQRDESSLSLMSTDSNDGVLPPKKEKKSLRFAEYSQLYFVPSLEEFRQDELDAIYMTDEDYDRISRENQQTLALMNKGIYPDDEQLYFRGLEIGMIQFYLEKRHMVSVAVSAVLTRQEEKKVIEPAWVEQYYTRITSQSMMNAYRIGLWDAHALQATQSKVHR